MHVYFLNGIWKTNEFNNKITNNLYNSSGITCLKKDMINNQHAFYNN